MMCMRVHDMGSNSCTYTGDGVDDRVEPTSLSHKTL